MDKKLRILIVEDVASDAELVARELVKEGLVHTSKWVKSKDEFLKALGEYLPDVILCDYNMPDFGALKALEIIKEMSLEIPFIVVSGTIGEDVAVEMMKSGAADYVMKDKIFRLALVVNRALKENEGNVERKRAEKALQDSDKRFMDVLYASKDPILLIDDNLFVVCNEATVQMLGYSTRKEFLMMHPSKLAPEIQPDGKSSFDKAEEMMKIAQKKGYHRFEWMYRKANGDDFLSEVSLTSVSFQGKSIIHCVWRDLTEIKEREKVERQHLKELEIFYKAAIGREERIIELKKEVIDLKKDFGKQGKV